MWKEETKEFQPQGRALWKYRKSLVSQNLECSLETRKPFGIHTAWLISPVMCCFFLPHLILKYYQDNLLHVSANISPASTSQLPHSWLHMSPGSCCLIALASSWHLLLFSCLWVLLTSVSLSFYHILSLDVSHANFEGEKNLSSSAVEYQCCILILLCFLPDHLLVTEKNTDQLSLETEPGDTAGSNSCGQRWLVYVVRARGSHDTEHGHLCWREYIRDLLVGWVKMKIYMQMYLFFF